MLVNGPDCSIAIKTAHGETNIPYSDETIREAVILLQEEAAIEGDGVRRGIRKANGVTGCVVTPLTVRIAPLLLSLAMGTAGKLLPMEDTEHFSLIQNRNGIRKLYKDCRVKGFELRILREEAVKLKLDICGNHAPIGYPFRDIPAFEAGERYDSDFVSYWIDGEEYQNIYGLTLLSDKEGGTRTQVWIKRALEYGKDFPTEIGELTILAVFPCERGSFRISLKDLIMVSDQTEVNATGAVIGPVRYFVSGSVTSEIL